MAECAGFGKRQGAPLLHPCAYPAPHGSDYCYFHEKVVAGLITDAGHGRRLSWEPKRRPADDLEREPEELLAMLLREWDAEESPESLNTS